MDLEACYDHVKIIKVFQNWFDIQFRKAVFMQLCFLLFSQPITIRKMTSGGVLESQDLLLIMGTEILKIDAEMAQKIVVEVGNPHLKTDRKAEK